MTKYKFEFVNCWKTKKKSHVKLIPFFGFNAEFSLFEFWWLGFIIRVYDYRWGE